MTPQELRDAREKLGLFQNELYIKAGLGTAAGRTAQKVHVSRMERGVRPITKATADKVLALLERETE